MENWFVLKLTKLGQVNIMHCIEGDVARASRRVASCPALPSLPVSLPPHNHPPHHHGRRRRRTLACPSQAFHELLRLTQRCVVIVLPSHQSISPRFCAQQTEGGLKLLGNGKREGNWVDEEEEEDEEEAEAAELIHHLDVLKRRVSFFDHQLEILQVCLILSNSIIPVNNSGSFEGPKSAATPVHWATGLVLSSASEFAPAKRKWWCRPPSFCHIHFSRCSRRSTATTIAPICWWWGWRPNVWPFGPSKVDHNIGKLPASFEEKAPGTFGPKI
jgi:hypothetical protein